MAHEQLSISTIRWGANLSNFSKMYTGSQFLPVLSAFCHVLHSMLRSLHQDTIKPDTLAYTPNPICVCLIRPASYHESLSAWKHQPQICLGIHLAITYDMHNPSLHHLPLAISTMH